MSLSQDRLSILFLRFFERVRVVVPDAYWDSFNPLLEIHRSFWGLA